ncbi:MAG: hypothetical protein ACE19M_00640 [Candidatus Karelsulcia muelleri]
MVKVKVKVRVKVLHFRSSSLVESESFKPICTLLKNNLNKLETICDGIFKVEKLSIFSLENIISFGVLNSSYLIAEKIKELDLKGKCKDSRKLILTDYEYGCYKIDLKQSYSNLINFFKKEKSQSIIFPGIIAFSS